MSEKQYPYKPYYKPQYMAHLQEISDDTGRAKEVIRRVLVTLEDGEAFKQDMLPPMASFEYAGKINMKPMRLMSAASRVDWVDMGKLVEEAVG